MPVVDASIVVDWVAPGVDPGGPAARLLARLGSASEAVLAPRLVLEETANALVISASVASAAPSATGR